jgi:hypothetical protein
MHSEIFRRTGAAGWTTATGCELCSITTSAPAPCGQNSHPRPGEVDDSECFKSFWAFPLCASFSTSQSALESHFHKKTEGPVNDLDADAVIYHWDCGPGTAAAE